MASTTHITVHALRACQLCQHHQVQADGMACANPRVAGARNTVPCTQARQAGGGCGPDAMQMHWPRIECVPPARPLHAHFTGRAWGAAS